MPIARLAEIVIDVPAERVADVARFYGELLGYSGAADAASNPSNPLLEHSKGIDLGLQRVDGYMPPTWPTQERGQQIHVMLATRSVEETVAAVERLGGSKASHQPMPEGAIVLDPVGHPMCVYVDDAATGDHPTIDGIAIDCADHAALAAFYVALFDARIEKTDDREYTSLVLPNGMRLSCEQVEGYCAPTWPTQERGQQVHVDTAVGDLDEAIARVEGLGGTILKRAEGSWRFAVAADPAGHPLCLGERDEDHMV